MAEILPSIIAGARGGGRVQGGNALLPVIEADIASQAATSLARTAGNFIGVAAQYSDRQVALAKQEQQVLALQAHNKYNAAMGEWNTNYIQNAKTEDWIKYDEKRITKQTELDKEFSSGLSPFALKKYKQSNILNEQAFKTQAQNYRAKQLTINTGIQVTNTAKISEATAIQMNTDATMAQAMHANGKLADFKGLNYTQVGVDSYAKSTGIEIDSSKPLIDQKNTLEKSMKGLDITSNEFKEKNELLKIMSSAIGREQFLQSAVDRVQVGKFERYIKEENLLSAGNLVKNASPEGGGYQVSEAVLASMKSVLKQREDIAKVNIAVNDTMNQVRAGFNIKKQNASELEATAVKEKRTQSSKIKDPKLRAEYNKLMSKQLIETRKLIVSDQNKDYTSKVEEMQQMKTGTERANFLKKLSHDYGQEQMNKFTKAEAGISGIGQSNSQNAFDQVAIAHEVIQAAKEGGISQDGKWREIKTFAQVKTLFIEKDGIVNVASAKSLEDDYNNKDLVLSNAVLSSVLTSHGVKGDMQKRFIKLGGARAVAINLPDNPTPAQVNVEVGKWLAQKITTENWLNMDTDPEARSVHLGREHLYTKAQAEKLYKASYQDKKASGRLPINMPEKPDDSDIKVFMRNEFNYIPGTDSYTGYYRLESINPFKYIKGFK